ncbi:hypothetical protein J5U23_00547 [Saccharolobus shibatae B12]|uniref:Transposase n=1 Tax=Saccharolobus shibatae (strain ATCC 51178 / DSM 5389 / JCM 8931 / NBRC 15437 / B12) TaxID=523848 RepID=A0A8F5BLV1_SACSH|nr:hypothetical protein J5U23_00547 [Saccharolobus shibatae B12]
MKLHVVDGKSEKEVSKMLNKSYSTIKLWIGKYKKEGLDGLRDKPRSGRPRKVEEEKIKQILEDKPQKYGIQQEYWTMKTLKIALQEQGIDYKKSRLYELVHELGYNLVKPRPTNIQAEKEKWEVFKKIKKLEGKALFFLDECRAVISTSIKKVLAKVGSKPVMRVNIGFSSIYVIL